MADADVVAGKAADEWGLPVPALLRAGMSSVYVAGDVVLRVSTEAPSIELAGVLSAAGVHVPLPVRAAPIVVDGLAVTAWERLVAVDAQADWREVGRMVATVHALPADGIPVPLPRCDEFPWWQFDELVDDVGDLVDAAAMAGLRATIDRHRGWERWVDGVVCHGDVHPHNVVMTASGPALLDWDTMCLGPPGWDHAMLLRLARWGWPAWWYDEFARGYGRSLAGDPTAKALADLRLVAATLMRLRAARDDPAAMPQAQLRLAYWRDPAHAPTWTAV
jgi:Ser/Thr protein kinase RdoA (MazF antagonist)